MSLHLARALDDISASPSTGVSVEPRRRHGVRAAPQLSVVLVAVEDGPLPESLRAPLAACEAAGVEVVLVHRGPRTLSPSLRRAGIARTLTLPADASTEELRSVGMAAANGDIVTVCELPADGDEPGFAWPLAMAAARTRRDAPRAADAPAPRV